MEGCWVNDDQFIPYTSFMKLARLIFILNLIAFPGISQEINLEDELVARYIFNENTRNAVEDAYHGVETNVEYGTDRSGQPNSCLSLSGNRSYVTIPHTEVLNWDARSESYSILFWVKSPDPTHGGAIGSRVLSKWTEILSDPYPFSFQYSSEFLGNNIYEAGVTPLSVRIADIWDDGWHHVSMVYSHDASSLSVFLDGLFTGTNTHKFAASTLSDAPIYIGRTLTRVLEGFYKGLFDDLYFYNRAIEQCEVEALYSGQLLEER